MSRLAHALLVLTATLAVPACTEDTPPETTPDAASGGPAGDRTLLRDLDDAGRRSLCEATLAAQPPPRPQPCQAGDRNPGPLDQCVMNLRETGAPTCPATVADFRACWAAIYADPCNPIPDACGWVFVCGPR